MVYRVESKEIQINPENHVSRRYDAVFVFPGYTLPQEEISGGLKTRMEGIVEQIAGLPQKTHRTGLLFDSRLKDIAAILMVRNKETKIIVTMSRSTKSWMRKSNAQLGTDHINSILNIKKSGIEIIQEEDSYDTLTEIQQVQRISRERGFGRIAIIVTDCETAKRVQKLIEMTGGEFPNYEIRDINSVILNPMYGTPQVRKHLSDIMQKYNNSLFLKFWRIREKFIRVLENINPSLLSKLARKTR